MVNPFPRSQKGSVTAEAAAERAGCPGGTSVPAAPGSAAPLLVSGDRPASASGEGPGSSPGRKRSGAILSAATAASGGRSAQCHLGNAI